MAQPIASPGPRDMQDHPTAPAERRWLVLVVVAIAQLMVVLDSTIVNIALPSAQRSLGFPNADRQWVVTGYALAFGSLLLVGSRLGDMYSRKWVLITGLIGFAVASAIGGAAVSFVMLVSARALQGAFGAILAPSALGTLVSTFRDPLERGRAFAVFGSVAVGGGAVGLILGGVLTQYLSWRYTLFVNLIFAAIAVAGALAYIRSSRPASPPRMDWPGAVLACAGLFLIVFGFSRAETAGWTATLTLGSLVLGAVLLTAFVVAEQRSSHPLLPLRVILDRTRGGSYVAVGITGIALFAIFLFLTFYMQQVKGYSPLTTGLLFLPLTAGSEVGPRARCRRFRRSFPAGPLPHRACASRRTRRSTCLSRWSAAGDEGCCRCRGPWGRDVAAAIAVAGHRDAGRAGEYDPVPGEPPPLVAEAIAELLHPETVLALVLTADPAHQPQPCVAVDGAEHRLGHPVPEVVRPARQGPVQAADQLVEILVAG